MFLNKLVLIETPLNLESLLGGWLGLALIDHIMENSRVK